VLDTILELVFFLDWMWFRVSRNVNKKQAKSRNEWKQIIAQGKTRKEL
jgi:preprotein translocase subunit YajC